MTDDKDERTTKPEPTTPEEEILQFFKYDHLPFELAQISKIFADVAELLIQLPRNAERSAALRKLLESKDAAVRARLVKRK